MSYLKKSWNSKAAALFAAGAWFIASGVVQAQDRGPRDTVEAQWNATYGSGAGRRDSSAGNAIRDRRAGRIAELSRARARGEDVKPYNRRRDLDAARRDYGVPIPRGYAQIEDSRYYHRDAAESPQADDRRPLRAPSSGHFDPRIGNYDDFGPHAAPPLGRSSRGGKDRPDAPGYLNHAGRDSSLANGYSTRGVEEFTDARGQGVRLDDLYPLDPSVNPRRYRGHYDWRTYGVGYTDEDEDRDIEALVRRELLVRPGANLRVSSTGTYTLRNYIDYGNQVMARFRLPVHKRWQYYGEAAW